MLRIVVSHPSLGRRVPVAIGRCVMMAVVAIILVASASLVSAQPWPRFRGANGEGQSEATNIPTKWTDADYNWQVELEGTGHSSPVVWGDKVVVTSADSESAARFVHCRRTSDGGEVWSKSFASSPHRLHRKNSYASSTPALDGKRVFVTWATPQEYWVVALDFDTGEEIWREDLGGYRSAHGYGSSPIVFEGKVIVTKDHNGESFLLALDCEDGHEVWKSPRGPGGKAAYSVPCLFTTEDGQRSLVFHSTDHGISGLDPNTGKVKWSASDVFVKRCVNSPVVAAGLVFGTAGQAGNGDAVVAVRPGGGADGAELAYEVRKAAPYVITPVVYQDMLFVWHDSGIVSCLHAKDGEVHWRERVGGSYSGSPIRIGDHIYCTSEDGKVVVLDAAGTFRLVAENDLGERSFATPAVSDGRMYLRTETRLMSLGGK